MKKVIFYALGFVLASCASEEKKTDDDTSGDDNPPSHETVIEKSSTTKDNVKAMNFHDFKVNDLSGAEFDMSQLQGSKVLVVNTASECGLTPQYEQLQELYDEFGGEEFTIVGFPANNFGEQEPGSDEEIAGFCQKNYGVTFPMMSKVSVKGDDVHEVYAWLIAQQVAISGDEDFEPAWNFHKFMIDENGKYIGQISPQTLPTDEVIINWITE